MKGLASFPGAKYDLVILAGSAGGLPAVLKVIDALPASFPAAVIYVQHMAPRQPSLLAEILARRTAMKVKQAQDQEVMQAGTVYIAVPDWHLTVTPQGKLELSQEPPLRFMRPSIDTLLESAAEVFAERLVVVILSGMGSDGALGVGSVKQFHGKVIVENPQDALHRSMPGAAIHTGSVDEVLSLDEIGPYILQLVMLDKVS